MTPNGEIHSPCMTIPTFETATMGNLYFTSFDLDEERLWPLWRHFMVECSGVIWFVESSAPDKLQESCQRLHRLLSEPQLLGVPVLVFANKQDLPHSLAPEQVCSELGLREIRGRRWAVMPSVARDGDGLCPGIDWLQGAMKLARPSPTFEEFYSGDALTKSAAQGHR
eukprot:CAMPEP_0175811374 /NCGR_PEP_ID=MMETSP0107_2-20121207/3813_1 /TAXON_ID=195067 ORGANISM="Goniomonas pacifica, Strain CCMP1869" /NCGR_SAMPLE_ID=MMETSP0107_2 /ASSEMBLY_ACC=CAM_ASM_000203 /LENGTH=167 /DNA_ID=CAMNT_0017123173 /DNA_START=139 /DNA_END=642 /DNA_ORIENTATION=-